MDSRMELSLLILLEEFPIIILIIHWMASLAKKFMKIQILVQVTMITNNISIIMKIIFIVTANSYQSYCLRIIS